MTSAAGFLARRAPHLRTDLQRPLPTRRITQRSGTLLLFEGHHSLSIPYLAFKCFPSSGTQGEMEKHWIKRLRVIARLVVETSVFIAVIAQSICWLSGWPLLSLLWNQGESPTQSLASRGNRVFALSPAVKVQPRSQSHRFSSGYLSKDDSATLHLVPVRAGAWGELRFAKQPGYLCDIVVSGVAGYDGTSRHRTLGLLRTR